MRNCSYSRGFIWSFTHVRSRTTLFRIDSRLQIIKRFADTSTCTRDAKARKEVALNFGFSRLLCKHSPWSRASRNASNDTATLTQNTEKRLLCPTVDLAQSYSQKQWYSHIITHKHASYYSRRAALYRTTGWFRYRSHNTFTPITA